MSNQLNVSVLVAARDEYSDQLKRHLQPLIQEGFTSIYEDSVEEDGDNPLRQFQIFLKQVPKWNQSILDQETLRIKEKCPFLMDMVTAIFVSHVKILASVRLGGKHSNIKIKIPTPEIFIHSVYVAGAECFYYNPELFEDNLDRINSKKIKNIIETNIDDTVSSMIPIRSILQEYLCNTFSDHIKNEPQVKEEEEEDLSDILNGNDIMEPSSQDSSQDYSGYESEKTDLSELFTPMAENNSNKFGNDDDPIFPIGDNTSFSDKIDNKDDKDDDYIKLDSLSSDDEDEDKNIKEIPVSDTGLGFLGLDEPEAIVDDSEVDGVDFSNIPDIPLNQDIDSSFNSSFNEPTSAAESDFNCFDNNDIL